MKALIVRTFGRAEVRDIPGGHTSFAEPLIPPFPQRFSPRDPKFPELEYAFQKRMFYNGGKTFRGLPVFEEEHP